MNPVKTAFSEHPSTYRTPAATATVPRPPGGVSPATVPNPDVALRRAGWAAPETVVRLRDVRRQFDDHVVLDGISLEIGAGEFVSVLGRSGTGKSTLLRALDGYDHGVSGHIEVPVRRAFVYQDARLLPWARVLENVILGLKGNQARVRGQQILHEVDLTHREHAWPVTLSGGEAQRVALARALLREPDLLLLDEPFGALDALTRIAMHELLRSLCDRHHPAVLLVTHDVNEAIVLSDRIVVLDGGRVIHDQPVDVPGPRTLQSPEVAALREDLHAKLGVEPAGTSTRSSLKAPFSSDRASRTTRDRRETTP